MSQRRLSPPERAVWGQVARTVKPYAGKVVPDVALDEATVPRRRPGPSPKQATALELGAAPRPSPAKSARPSANTLDAGWDKRLSKGMVSPDRVIDLHGDTLGSAYARLNFALSDALLCGERLILLITGKPARDNPRLPPTSRGVIRASVADWLASSSHAIKIAAVRNAHPRHGGAGALYVILRRARD